MASSSSSVSNSVAHQKRPREADPSEPEQKKCWRCDELIGADCCHNDVRYDSVFKCNCKREGECAKGIWHQFVCVKHAVSCVGIHREGDRHINPSHGVRCSGWHTAPEFCCQECAHKCQYPADHGKERFCPFCLSPCVNEAGEIHFFCKKHVFAPIDEKADALARAVQGYFIAQSKVLNKS